MKKFIPIIMILIVVLCCKSKEVMCEDTIMKSNDPIVTLQYHKIMHLYNCVSLISLLCLALVTCIYLI